MHSRQSAKNKHAMKYASVSFQKLKDLFLKQYFSESRRWDMSIQCTDQSGYQEYFHHWMMQLKYLYMPEMEEEQTINLIVKHFPISVQTCIQSCMEKNVYPSGRNQKTSTRSRGLRLPERQTHKEQTSYSSYFLTSYTPTVDLTQPQ